MNTQPGFDSADREELDMQACLYVSGELSAEAAAAFEHRLEHDLSACEAVARAVQWQDLLRLSLQNGTRSGGNEAGTSTSLRSASSRPNGPSDLVCDEAAQNGAQVESRAVHVSQQDLQVAMPIDLPSDPSRRLAARGLAARRHGSIWRGVLAASLLFGLGSACWYEVSRQQAVHPLALSQQEQELMWTWSEVMAEQRREWVPGSEVAQSAGPDGSLDLDLILQDGSPSALESSPLDAGLSDSGSQEELASRSAAGGQTVGSATDVRAMPVLSGDVESGDDTESARWDLDPADANGVHLPSWLLAAVSVEPADEDVPSPTPTPIE